MSAAVDPAVWDDKPCPGCGSPFRDWQRALPKRKRSDPNTFCVNPWHFQPGHMVPKEAFE